jgi:hypothetical protein
VVYRVRKAERGGAENGGGFCALCKPHKLGWDHRWKPEQRQALLEVEKEIRAVLRQGQEPRSGTEPSAPPTLGLSTGQK